MCICDGAGTFETRLDCKYRQPTVSYAATLSRLTDSLSYARRCYVVDIHCECCTQEVLTLRTTHNPYSLTKLTRVRMSSFEASPRE